MSGEAQGTAADLSPVVAQWPEGLRGSAVLARTAYNRDAAFTEEERDVLGLRGLMPYGVATLAGVRAVGRLAGGIRPDPSSGDHYDLQAVVRHVTPTILVGTTGTAGAFTPDAIRAMAAQVSAPIVMPLSNPTAKSEARPTDVLAWSGGRAIVATGSPFEPVTVGGRPRVIGQANNVFIFPGLGLGAIVARAREVTDAMFIVAARTLADLTPPERLTQGALYPRLAELRSISRAIAIAVAREAHDSGAADAPDRDVDATVDAAMWQPTYASMPLSA